MVNGSNEELSQQKSKAPLVDSALLRFLSSQKSPPNTSSQQFKIKSPSAENRAAGEKAVVEVNVLSLATESFLEEQVADTSTTTTAPDIDQQQKIIESQSWLSQYNAQKVALKLQALGVDEPTSLNAGKIVQDYVLARVTRRRIRKFLQERDASWESGNPLPFDRSGMKDNMSPETTINYDMDGVIDVLSEYGLTGIDIAAVFSHTPSVVMMKARGNSNLRGDEVVDVGRKGFTLSEALDCAFVGLLGDTLKLRRYDARKVSRIPASHVLSILSDLNFFHHHGLGSTCLSWPAHIKRVSVCRESCTTHGQPGVLYECNRTRQSFAAPIAISITSSHFPPGCVPEQRTT